MIEEKRLISNARSARMIRQIDDQLQELEKQKEKALFQAKHDLSRPGSAVLRDHVLLGEIQILIADCHLEEKISASLAIKKHGLPWIFGFARNFGVWRLSGGLSQTKDNEWIYQAKLSNLVGYELSHEKWFEKTVAHSGEGALPDNWIENSLDVCQQAMRDAEINLVRRIKRNTKARDQGRVLSCMK